MSDNRTADWLDDRDQAHDFLKEYMGEEEYAKARAKRKMETTVVEVGYIMRKHASQQTASLREENERLKELTKKSKDAFIALAKMYSPEITRSIATAGIEEIDKALSGKESKTDK
jgi:hypothetical protein